jgi:hypothetical protein
VNDNDQKSENRKARLTLMVATMFSATPSNLRITQGDVNQIIDAAFDLEARVMKKLEAQ